MHKGGMITIIFGVLLLVVGLVLSDIIIDNVNRQGRRIACFDQDDVPLSGAKYAGTESTARAVPKSNPDTSIVGSDCGTDVTVASGAITDYGTGRQGTVRYSLDVYGAASLNNLFTLIYWIVLVTISLSAIGGGGYQTLRAARAG